MSSHLTELLEGVREATGLRVDTMLCTFCGTDNRLDNKFCGMCGVRLERRKVERRAYRSSSSLNCQACGHANEPGHRFCGMCGAVVDRRSQERRAQAAEQPPVSALVNAQLPAPEIPETPVATAPEPTPSAIATEPAVEVVPAKEVPPPRTAPARRPAPVRPRGIGGPSFLGLNDDPGTSAEYLLEDDGSSGGVIHKLVLVTVLAVIAGSAFVYWRSSLRAAPKAHEQVKTQPAAAGAENSSSGISDTASSSGAQPASSSTTKPDSTAAAPATNEAADKQPAPTQPDAAKSPSPAETSDSTSSAKDKAATARQKQKAAEDAQAKPSAALVKAQQLLQGRGGVSPNCEQGLVFLRAAAQKNEPAAAVQMSTLYATGHCVQQDRVMAYRWLNSAHELSPGNSSIQTSMDVLWGQMTSQERRQASR